MVGIVVVGIVVEDMAVKDMVVKDMMAVVESLIGKQEQNCCLLYDVSSHSIHSSIHSIHSKRHHSSSSIQ